MSVLSNDMNLVTIVVWTVLCLHSLSPLSSGLVMVSCRVVFLHLHSFSISSAFSLFIHSVRQFFFYKCKPHAVGGR